MYSFIKDNLIWKEGAPLLLFSIFISILAYLVHPIIFISTIGLIAFLFYFFRNPIRTSNATELDLISPADGKVVDVSNNPSEEYPQKISIFLSPFDVHVNWTPMAGKIKHVIYSPGECLPAYDPKSSQVNERNEIKIENGAGRSILVRQIAGILARRIVCWVKPNDSIFQGHKYGMIKFGSRVDILLPSNVKITVKLDDRVYGGQTILGRWDAD